MLAAWCLQCFGAVGWAAGRASGLLKTEWWGAGMVICLEWGADLHMAQLMPLPLTVSCFSKIQIGFTFLVPAHWGSPGQRAVKRVCVCLTAAFNCRILHDTSLMSTVLPCLWPVRPVLATSCSRGRCWCSCATWRPTSDCRRSVVAGSHWATTRNATGTGARTPCGSSTARTSPSSSRFVGAA